MKITLLLVAVIMVCLLYQTESFNGYPFRSSFRRQGSFRAQYRRNPGVRMVRSFRSTWRQTGYNVDRNQAEAEDDEATMAELNEMFQNSDKTVLYFEREAVREDFEDEN